jgi:teichoic acid transport system permease protein
MLIKDIWESRRLIFNLAKSDFKAKYAGSVFGIIWAFVQPVITVLIYVIIFGMGIKMTPDTTEYPFLLYLIAGIVPWFFFVEAWQSATNCLVDYSYLVKKMVFKIHILPVVKVIASLFVHLFLVVIAFVIFVIMGRVPGITMIQIFYYMFCEICLILALSYATASVTPYFKDMTQLLNVCLQLGMWLTPIMWDEGFWPEWVMRIFRLNPMYYIVTGYRDCYMHGGWITDHL